ncbi:MAG: insulinase family protein [Bacteroidales bacterium]|nr:insulinase family protein [Bacteroidales bacterium]
MKIIEPDRRRVPRLKTIESPDITLPSPVRLDNGIELYDIRGGANEIINLSFYFKGSAAFYNSLTLAGFTVDTLLKGSAEYNMETISNIIDYYGIDMDCDLDRDRISISITLLKKHLDKFMPFLEDIIKNASFPEEEIDLYLKNTKQSFIIKQQKTAYICKTKFREKLFGVEHPYGNNVRIEDFSIYNNKEFKEFHNNNFTYNNCYIVISGYTDDKLIKLINVHFGQNNWSNNFKAANTIKNTLSDSDKKSFLLKPDAIQSAIRIGRIVCNHKHPDYIGLSCLKTILGGYFGSRLMTNIREHKGYTYGINAILHPFCHSASLIISTQTGNKYTKKVVNEIYKEIKRLQEKKVSASELNLVKNYTIGNYLRSVGNPISKAKVLSLIKEFQLENDYFIKYLDEYKKLTGERIQEMAVKYLNPDEMFEMIVGNN